MLIFHLHEIGFAATSQNLLARSIAQLHRGIPAYTLSDQRDTDGNGNAPGTRNLLTVAED